MNLETNNFPGPSRFGRKRYVAKLLKTRASNAKAEWILRSLFSTAGERAWAEAYLRKAGYSVQQLDAIPRGAR